MTLLLRKAKKYEIRTGVNVCMCNYIKITHTSLEYSLNTFAIIRIAQKTVLQHRVIDHSIHFFVKYFTGASVTGYDGLTYMVKVDRLDMS